MYRGTELWNNRIPLEMVERTLSNGRVIETFPDLPENMYEALSASAEKYPDKSAVIDDLGRR